MKIRSTGDGLDIDALNDLATHPGYALVLTRQARRRSVLTTDLENAKTWDEARYLQGRLADLDVSLALPRMIADEIRAKEKQRT